MFGEGMGSDANITRDVLAAAAVVRTPPQKDESGALPRPQKRARTATEPGQPAHFTRLRVRAPHVEASSSPPPAKKPHSIPANVSLLLDQAHARRMAAAAAAQPSAPPPFTTLMWTRRKTQRLLAHLHSGLAGIICRTLPHAVNAATSLAPVARDGMRRRDAIPIRTAITIDGARLICSVDVQELHRRTLVSCAT